MPQVNKVDIFLSTTIKQLQEVEQAHQRLSRGLPEFEENTKDIIAAIQLMKTLPKLLMIPPEVAQDLEHQQQQILVILKEIIQALSPKPVISITTRAPQATEKEAPSCNYSAARLVVEDAQRIIDELPCHVSIPRLGEHLLDFVLHESPEATLSDALQGADISDARQDGLLPKLKATAVYHELEYVWWFT